jgi:hypothetical protein
MTIYDIIIFNSKNSGGVRNKKTCPEAGWRK